MNHSSILSNFSFSFVKFATFSVKCLLACVSMSMALVLVAAVDARLSSAVVTSLANVCSLMLCAPYPNVSIKSLKALLKFVFHMFHVCSSCGMHFHSWYVSLITPVMVACFTPVFTMLTL